VNVPDPPPRGPIVAYALYDFANSAFVTVIGTFVFATYFTNAVAADRTVGAGQWSLAMAVAGVVIALASPVFGAIADQTGRRLPWLGVLSILCVAATGLLWLVRPTPADAGFALFWAAVSTVGFEIGMLFYNALLPAVAPPRLMGRVSGWSWGVGYGGGLLCLAVALYGLVQAEPPPFGLDPKAAEPVRATALLTAAWFTVFAVPLFVLVREPRGAGVPLRRAVGRGLRQLVHTLRHARRHGNAMRFLLAAMIYSDAVHTIFTLGGVYAAATYGMDIAGVIKLGIALNVTAGIGAALGGWIDDRFGSRRTIVWSLIALLITSAAVLIAPDERSFWIAALAMSTFFGPVQAASRTLMARIAPPAERTEMFGLFALSGKVTAFLGPALVGWITLATGSQRLGLSSVLVFFGVGLWLMADVHDQPEG
jgi:UMF1 family MFS transporter